MLNDLFKYIINKVPPSNWKIDGFSIGVVLRKKRVWKRLKLLGHENK